MNVYQNICAFGTTKRHIKTSSFFSFFFLCCFLVQFRLLLRVVDETTTQTSTTMKHRWAALPLFLLAFLVATVTGGCPPVDDPCMKRGQPPKVSSPGRRGLHQFDLVGILSSPVCLWILRQSSSTSRFTEWYVNRHADCHC